jgi:O-antigen/teichoic acid export membrane protein
LEIKLSSQDKSGYVIARGLATGLALLFALGYSKVLGVENRSIVTIIFTFSLISLTVFTSGIGLLFRSQALDPIKPISFQPFAVTAIISSLLTAASVLAAVSLYSHTKYPVPTTLIIFSLIYSFFGALDDLSHQSLIAYGKFKAAAKVDVSTIILQILLFVGFSTLTKMSSASALFMSLITSYIYSVSISLRTIHHIAVTTIPKNSLTVMELVKDSKAFHLVGISGGLADRVDRLLIGWFLPLSFLGAYSVGTSLLTFLRFIPDAIGRLIVAKQNLGSTNKFRSKPLWIPATITLSFLLVSSAVFVSQSFVAVFMGKDWEISRWVIAAFAAQEVLRGLYLFVVSRRVASNNQDFIFKSSLLLIIGSVLGGYVGIKLFSGIGVPLGIGLSYGFLIAYSQMNRFKKLNSAGLEADLTGR